MPRSDLFLPLDGGENRIERADGAAPDAEAVHAFCERAMAESSQERPETELQAWMDACAERLEAILRLLRERTERIPVPRGFFVSEGERQKTYPEICRLLLLLDPMLTALRAEIASLGAIERLVEDARNRQDLSQRMLLLLRDEHKQKAQTERILTQIGKTAQGIDRQRARGKELLREMHALRGELSPLVSSLYPRFCEHMARAADMEQEGRSCDLPAARRLCTELADAVTARLRTLKQRRKPST